MSLPMVEGGTGWAKVLSYPQHSVMSRTLKNPVFLSASQSPDVFSDPGIASSEMQGAPVRACAVPQKGAVAGDKSHTTGSLRT